MEGEHLTAGVIWQGEPKERIDWDRLPGFTYNLGEVAPHSVQELPPFYLVAGNGNWETVRNWWKRLVQPSGVIEEQKPETVRVLEVKAEPISALLMEEEGTLKLSLINRRAKILTGKLTLQGEAFQVEPASYALEAVNRSNPFVGQLAVKGPAVPAASFLKAEVETGKMTETFQVPVVRLRSGGEVRVTHPEEGMIVVENGLLTLRFAPNFQGSLTALEREGVNHLYSAYPQARAMAWSNPWFGGVHSSLNWMGSPDLGREKFRGEAIERVGESGLRWQGVQTVSDLEHKDRSWLRVETEFLTLPGSNVVAVITRRTNRTTARMDTYGGVAAWTQIGGTRENSLLHWMRGEERRHQRNSSFSSEGDSGRWVAVENSTTGDVLTLITTHPSFHAGFEDFGVEGQHLQVRGSFNLGPNETKETLCWLVLSQDKAQIEPYAAALSQVRRLP